MSDQTSDPTIKLGVEIAQLRAHIEALNAELASIRAARGEKGPRSASKAAPVPRDEGCPVESF